ncbi:MAG: M28 family peptidase, partial [Candidatus Thermoplasmatota archaeon]
MKIKISCVLISTILFFGSFSVAVGQNVIIQPDKDMNQTLLYEQETLNQESDDLSSLILQVKESLVVNYISSLVAFGPRVTGTPACENAGNYIASTFNGMGLDVEIKPWNNGGYQGDNIEATLEGEDSSSDQIYIVCAHYDSVSGSPGADDNAAGTAAVMACAKVMSEYSFSHTVRFVTFSGEEQGLLG